ncbi:MAG: hypothetical protein M1299_13035 [Firmicutes bacterium]|nr:hypothetical protein [Bacillota bacterium]MCL5040713.1 hypothetical protein [Bacillota bacterium]
MRIKIDFITNSSSENFGVVLVDTAATMAATGAFTVLASSIKDIFTLGAAQDAAKEIAEAVAADAKKQIETLLNSYDEAEKMLDGERNKILSELDSLKKQWDEAKETADPKDPGYAKLKEQYEAYQKYLEDQLKEKEYAAYLIQKEKAEKQAAEEAQGEWIRQRQVDYIAVKEEKALLQATLRGYAGQGFDVNDIEQRLKQLEAKEYDLDNTLSKHGASIDYQARDRGTIGAGVEFNKIKKEFEKKRAELENALKYADAAKRRELQEKMARDEEEYREAMKAAYRWDLATKAAEGIEFGADVAIEGLSHITGPAGKSIKTIYKAGKNVAGGMGEGMADPKNAGKHLVKGLVGASTEVAKDLLGESPLKSSLANITGSALQGALEDGNDPLGGGLKGAVTGTLDSLADYGLDKIKSKLPIPKGSSVDVHDYELGKIFHNNPLNRGLTKTVLREGLGDKTKDFIKGGIVEKASESLSFGPSE